MQICLRLCLVLLLLQAPFSAPVRRVRLWEG